MDRAGVERWLASYGRAWQEMDPDLAVDLFTEDVSYQETPFDEPMRGQPAIRQYWAQVPEAQRDIRFRSSVLHVEDGTAIAHWTADFTRVATGGAVTLDGIFLLRFDDASGRCSSLREWWVRREVAP
jgi:ketosteroid isomerase-like protein